MRYNNPWVPQGLCMEEPEAGGGAAQTDPPTAEGDQGQQAPPAAAGDPAPEGAEEAGAEEDAGGDGEDDTA